MNVLITSASRKVNLVRAFQKAVGECGGGRVMAVDVDPLSPALYLADSSALICRSNDPNFAEEALALCQRENINVLVPTRDEELPIFSALKDRFAAAGVSIMIADPQTIRICQDKRRFTSFCAARNIGTAKIYESPADVRANNYPVFVRARTGKSSRSAYRVEDQTQLRYVCEMVAEPLIQEFIPWQEYTIDLFADFGSRVISVVPRERMTIVSGESYVSRTVLSWPLIDAATRIAEELGLVGHNNIQCFFKDNEVKAIEVNPRFGGASGLGFEAGAFTPLYLLRCCLGMEVEPVIGRFQTGLTMLRYTQDIYTTNDSLLTNAGYVSSSSL